MDKNKFIAEKIQKLVQSGKSKNQAITEAFKEYSGIEKMQEGSYFSNNNPQSLTKLPTNQGYQAPNYSQTFTAPSYSANNFAYNTIPAQANMTIPSQQPNPLAAKTGSGYQTDENGNIDYNAEYMGMTTEQEQLKPLSSDKNVMSKDEYDRIRLANLYGGNVSPQMYGYGLGRAIDKKDTVGAVVNGLGLGLGTVKNVLSGMGDARMADYTYNKYREDQMDDSSEYKPIMQSGGYIMERDNTYIPKPQMIKNAPKNKGGLTIEELKALAHQTVGEGEFGSTTYIKKPGPIMNDVGTLSQEQQKQLREYINRMNPLETFYAVLPNAGRIFGDGYSAADLPANSKLRMQEGGYIPQLKKKENAEIEETPPTDLTNAEMLTGEYLVEDGNPNKNVEVEKNEKVLHSDTGEIQTVVGNKHKENDINSGVKTELSEGSQVLSDYTKTGAKNAKYFSDIFNIKAEAGDTFAKTLNKIETKIGLKKLLKEEEELNLQIEKELSKQNPDEQTQNLNIQLLSEHSQEISKKKEEIEGIRKIAFQELFEKQELIPKKGRPAEILKQEGGVIEQEQPDVQKVLEDYAVLIQKDPRELIQMMQQMSPEKQKEALSQMYQALQPGAQSPQEEVAEGQMSNPQEDQQEMQYAQEGIRISNRLEDKNKFVNQDESGTGYYGEIVLNNPTDIRSENERLHPELYTNYFTAGQPNPKDTIGFQKAIKEDYNNILKSAETLYGKDSEKYKAIESNINKDTFLEDNSVRGTEGKYGNFSATRPNFSLEVLPSNELEKLNKEGINTASQLSKKYPELYKKYVGDKSLKGDFWLGKAPDNPATQTTPKEETQTAKVNRPDRVVLPNIPTYYGQAPTPPEPVVKGDISADKSNPFKKSIQPNLVEAHRQMMGTQGYLEGLPPSQRAVALQNLYNQNQGATNQAISQVEIANANSQMQTDQFNIGQSFKERLANFQNALSFEQRNLGTKAKYEANLDRYFNNIAAVDKQNWQDVNNLNYLNAKSDNFQTDGTNFYRTAQDPSIYNSYGGSYANLSLADKAAIDKKRAIDSEKAWKASITKNA